MLQAERQTNKNKIDHRQNRCSLQMRKPRVYQNMMNMGFVWIERGFAFENAHREHLERIK